MRYVQRISRILGLMLLSLTVVACSSGLYDGPYRGRVIDAETGKPIEGVVILGVWYKQISTAAGGVSSYYDAKETVTDKNGNFEIKGVERKLWTYVGPMNVLIFKAGYEHVGSYEWNTLKRDPRKITWEDEKPSIPLRKLTMEERKESATFPSLPPADADLDKVKLMLREVNKEAFDRGIKPIDIWRGKKP